MEEAKFVQRLLENKKTNVIQKINDEHEGYACFEGTPKRHPVDPSILLLLTNPFEEEKKFFEFTMDNIIDIEELDTISSSDGDTAQRVRIWVPKGVLAFKTEPFIVK